MMGGLVDFQFVGITVVIRFSSSPLCRTWLLPGNLPFHY